MKYVSLKNGETYIACGKLDKSLITCGKIQGFPQVIQNQLLKSVQVNYQVFHESFLDLTM